MVPRPPRTLASSISPRFARIRERMRCCHAWVTITDPPVSDPVSGASSLEGIGEKPPEDQVQPYDNEERPEDGKFQRCALPDHHRFPEDGETAPKEAERDEKDIASAQHESRLRPTRPQQPLASLQ